MLYVLLFSFVSKNLTNYGRRHLKLFTNCHVSWDTLYHIVSREVFYNFNVIFGIILDKINDMPNKKYKAYRALRTPL